MTKLEKESDVRSAVEGALEEIQNMINVTIEESHDTTEGRVMAENFIIAWSQCQEIIKKHLGVDLDG